LNLDSSPDLLHLPSVQIVASAHYMLSELFQLDEPPEGDEGESLRGGGSEDSYSDEDREEEEELTEDSDENGSYGSFSSPQDDSKAVAVIRSVGELSVPEKYKSTHQIRVSAPPNVFSFKRRERHTYTGTCVCQHQNTSIPLFSSHPPQPSGAFPVSRDKEERCRHVLSYALKASLFVSVWGSRRSATGLITVTRFTGAEGGGRHHQEGERSPSRGPQHAHSSEIRGQKCNRSRRARHVSPSGTGSVYSPYFKG